VLWTPHPLLWFLYQALREAIAATADMQPDYQCSDVGFVVFDKFLNFFVTWFPHLVDITQEQLCLSHGLFVSNMQVNLGKAFKIVFDICKCEIGENTRSQYLLSELFITVDLIVRQK
jgi:hypothetical protein